MTRSDGDNRGFPGHARTAFAFLEQSGLRVADGRPWCVRFESPHVVVSITYGSYDYEVDVGLAATGLVIVGAPVAIPLATMVAASALATRLFDRTFASGEAQIQATVVTVASA